MSQEGPTTAGVLTTMAEVERAFHFMDSVCKIHVGSCILHRGRSHLGLLFPQFGRKGCRCKWVTSGQSPGRERGNRNRPSYHLLVGLRYYFVCCNGLGTGPLPAFGSVVSGVFC